MPCSGANAFWRALTTQPVARKSSGPIGPQAPPGRAAGLVHKAAPIDQHMISPRQNAGRCLFDHDAKATIVYLVVRNPENTGRNAGCNKALHLEIPSKKSPHLESVVEVDRRGAKAGS